MIPVLVAAIVMIGAVALLNLFLVVGVMRRLRQHADALSRLLGSGAPPALAGIGQPVAEFATTTVDGQPLDHHQLSGETLVGFFTPHCELCKIRLPDFVSQARSMPSGPDRVLAVAVGETDDVAGIVAALRPVARVVVERHGGPLGNAFAVTAYPTVVMVAPDEDGRVVVVDNHATLRPAASSPEARGPSGHARAREPAGSGR